MSGTPTPRSFRIDAELLGGKVAVDGIGEVDCLDYEVIGGHGDRPTRLILHVAGDGVVEGEGIVHVVRDGGGDAVRRLDPKKIEDEALARLSMSQGSLPRHRLDVIAEMLDAQAAP